MHSHEAWLWTERRLWTELRESRSLPATPPAGGSGPRAARGMRRTDPPALAAWVPPDVPRAPVPGSLGGRTVRMTLCAWQGPLSVLGRWGGVHTTTRLRGVLGLALALWPLLSQGRGERVTAQMVAVDEQWRKIRGRWRYGFVVLDVPPELPVLTALLPSRRPWACRWLGRQLRVRTHVPRVRITAGLQAYTYLVPGAKHVCCRVQHHQGVTHWVPQQCTTDAAMNTRTPVMKQVRQPPDTRTVRRRLARLRERAPAWGMTPWGSRVDAQLPGLIGSVGSVRLPATTPAIARFFRALPRCYPTRGGFHALLRATRERLLVLVVAVCTPHATTGHAPRAGIVPEARRMPLYRWLHDPFRALQERGSVQATATLADGLRPQEAGA